MYQSSDTSQKYIYQIHVSFIRYKSKVHLPDRCFWLVSDEWYIYLVNVLLTCIWWLIHVSGICTFNLYLMNDNQIDVSIIRYKSKVHLPDRCINHQIQVKSTYSRYMYHSSDTSQEYIYQIDVSIIRYKSKGWMIHLSGKCTFDLYLMIDTCIWYMYF
jgi:hypothetical protein